MTGSHNEELLERYQNSVMGVFGLPPLVLSHGDGCYVWDVDGRRYLDLTPEGRGDWYSSLDYGLSVPTG